MFPELESDDAAERPDFDTTPSAPKEDLQLSSGGIIPASIAQWLRNYQVEGVEFMYRLWKSGRGGILGDDMGLGSKPLHTRDYADYRNCPSNCVLDSCVWKEGIFDG
jgi:hypothetical protein